MKRLMLAAATAGLVAGVAQAEKPLYKDATQPVEQRVEDLLARMTVDEKIGQLYQSIAEPDWRPMEPQFDAVRKGGIGSFINLYREKKGSGATVDRRNTISRTCHDALQKVAVEESRLGIPLIFGHDVIHGCYTEFPNPLTLACAFEPALFEKAQHFAAREARWAGYDWTFTPMCDTARDPRWGRVMETCGEDPYLNAQCVVAQVKGFQGADVTADDRIPACMKHFVGYSDSMGGRDYNITECSEWTLRNLHLVPFRAAAAAGVETVMSSFNTVDGRPAVTARHTLTDILRGEWGFTGFVVSDWNAVDESITWGYSKDGAEAARKALYAGNDMEMFSQHYVNNLKNELAAGRLAQATLDEAVKRILRVKFRTGLFEKPYARPVPPQAELDAFTAAAHAAAKDCAAKSVVLVKNGGVLPLQAKKVALVGPLAEDREQMLGGWFARAENCRTTLKDELQRALGPDGRLFVAKGCAINMVTTAHTAEDGVKTEGTAVADGGVDAASVKNAVDSADVVVLALGEDRNWTGENHSRALLTLTGAQQELFDYVATLGKPMVVIVCSGRPLALPKIWEKADAIFYAGQPGCEGAAALADLLVGKAAPEGRLSMSVARDVSQVPVFYNSYRTGRPGSGRYDDVKDQSAKFPFGYGLAYTTFDFSETKIVGDTAVCTVKNTGARAGVAVPQLYIGAKACAEGVRPIRELRGFRKLALQPGETAEVRFDLTDEVLCYTDRAGALKVDPGTYEIKIAADSASGKSVSYLRK